MTRESTIVFIVLEAVCLGATQVFGGWPWTVIAGAALGAIAVVDLRPSALAMVVPGLVWLALFRFTGDRELFFPFTISLASLAALRSGRGGLARGVAGGGLIGGLFLAIRASQQATAKVLGVEALVVGLILAAVLAALPPCRQRPALEGAVVVLASLAAYASLAL